MPTKGQAGKRQVENAKVGFCQLPGAMGNSGAAIFAMGMMPVGMLSRVVTDWAGDGRVKRFKVRFLGLVWPTII